MYAIIETGGLQFRVEENEKVKVPRLQASPGETFKIPRVLFIAEGDNTLIGTPTLNEAEVLASVMQHGRGEKIVGFKYKPKKKYRRHWGARQDYTELLITKIAHPAFLPTKEKPEVEKVEALKEVPEIKGKMVKPTTLTTGKEKKKVIPPVKKIEKKEKPETKGKIVEKKEEKPKRKILGFLSERKK